MVLFSQCKEKAKETSCCLNSTLALQSKHVRPKNVTFLAAEINIQHYHITSTLILTNKN